MSNGHPADKYGWAVAGGAKFNLAGGDAIGFNVCLPKALPASAPTTPCSRSTIPTPAWASAGSPTACSPTAPKIELTRVWSAHRLLRAHLEPALAHLVVRRLRQRRLQQHCHRPDPAARWRRLAGLRRPFAGLVGTSESPRSRATAAAPTTTSRKSARGRSGTRSRSSISASKCSTPSATPPSKAPPSVPASGSRPPVFVIDDQDVWSAMFRWQRNFYP